MTDELVKRLRGWDHCWPAPWLERAVTEAADRIEQLTTQLAEDRDARVLMDDRLEQLVSQVDALTSGAAKMLAEQDCDYNRKTNDLIKRHAEQVKALTAERDRLREALNQSRLAFAGHVSVQSAIDMIDCAALDPNRLREGVQP